MDGLRGSEKNRGTVITSLQLARVQEAWQEFYAFYHSFIKRLRWQWKTCQTHLASIWRACLQISPFETVILYSFWDIPQIKTVKPPDKKPSISDRYSFLRRRSVKFQFVWQKRCYNIPLAELLQKHVDLRDSSAKCQNSLVCLRKMCLMVSWKRTFNRNDDLSKPCQSRQLKLNPLSTPINIYILSNY